MKPQSQTYTERLQRPETSEVPAMGWVVGRTLRGLRTFARRNPLSAFWGCVAALIILVAILAPLIAPYDPLKANFRRMAKAPDVDNYFGTDQIGRDNLSRVIRSEEQ